MNPDVSFASFLTPEGIIVAGGLITAFVQLLKSTFPVIDEKVSGAVMAFVLSALLYVATTFATGGIPTWDAGLTILASWIACATASVGVYASVRHVQDVT